VKKLKRIKTTGFVKGAGDRFVGRILRSQAVALNHIIDGINGTSPDCFMTDEGELGWTADPILDALWRAAKELELDKELVAANPELRGRTVSP
jgi:hypothetical protein